MSPGLQIFRINLLLCFQGLFIRMSKHPSCYRLTGDVLSNWTEGEGRRVLLRGSVAELCPMAPNNVNTMAAAAVAAGTLGFTGVQGEIVSDTAWVLMCDGSNAAFHICMTHTSSRCRLSDYHVVEVEVTGPGGFTVNTVRKNPTTLGAVTGSATYSSFWNSLLGESCILTFMREIYRSMKYKWEVELLVWGHSRSDWAWTMCCILKADHSLKCS